MRELPSIEIIDQPFYIDVFRGYIQNSKPPHNTIRFEDMENVQGHELRRFLYDAQRKERYIPAKGQERLPPHVAYVELIHETIIDPVGYLRAHGMPEKYLPKDFELPPVLHKARVLPTVDIEGTAFFMDVVLKELKSTTDPACKVQFAHIRVRDERMCFLYNTATRSSVAPFVSNASNKDIRLVYLPMLDKIDPVGWALLQGKPYIYEKPPPPEGPMDGPPKKIRVIPAPRWRKPKGGRRK